MLNNRQYVCALPVALMMVALVTAALAIPRADTIHFLAVQ
jgi:hypothetical protein